VGARDGASGAGGAVAEPLKVCDLNVVGSVNTAMTAEFTAAGGANTLKPWR
jgi:hypothetical protein